MNICILKESRKNEFRVPLIPKDIKELIKKNSKLRNIIKKNFFSRNYKLRRITTPKITL